MFEKKCGHTHRSLAHIMSSVFYLADEFCVELTRVANVDGETRALPLNRSISDGDERLVSESKIDSPLTLPADF